MPGAALSACCEATDLVPQFSGYSKECLLTEVSVAFASAGIRRQVAGTRQCHAGPLPSCGLSAAASAGKVPGRLGHPDLVAPWV